MRHRRDNFIGGRASYGNNKREHRSDWRERNRSSEQLSHRDRGEKDSSYNFLKSRNTNNSVTRQPERSSTFGHVNRGQIEKTENSDNSLNVESFKSYLNKNYCDTLDCRDASNDMGNEVNSKNPASESWRSLRLYAGSERQIRGQGFQTVSGNRFRREPSRQCDQFSSRPETNRNYYVSEQSGEYPVRGPTYQRPVQLLGEDLDFRRPRQEVSLSSNELSSLQDQVCGKRQRHVFRQPSRFEPVTNWSELVRNSIYGHECRVQHQRPNQFGLQHPVMHETFHPINPALFTQNGQPVLRREVPSCPSGLGLVAPTSDTAHIYRRDHIENAPEILSTIRQDTKWTYQKMPAWKEPSSCRPDEQFKPVCAKEALKYLSHADGSLKLKYMSHSPILLAQDESVHNAHIENVPTAKVYGGRTEPFGQFSVSSEMSTPIAKRDILKSTDQYSVHLNVSAPQGQAGTMEGVALIPLPLEPPPPPPLPPPAHSQQLLPDQVPIKPNFCVIPPPPPPPQSGEENGSQKSCSSNLISEKLSENQVSSTSMELHQLSSSAGIKDPLKTKSLETFGKKSLLQGSQKQNCEDKSQIIEKELKPTFLGDIKHQQISNEKYIEEGRAQDSAVIDSEKSNRRSFSVTSYAQLLPSDNTDVCNRVFSGKCYDENKTGHNLVRVENTTINNSVFTNDMKYKTLATVQDKPYRKNGFATNRGFDQKSEGTYHSYGRNHTRNFKSLLRKDDYLHRPWETDHWRNRQMKREINDFKGNSRGSATRRDEWSFEPSYRCRRYDDRRRLSGLGIHTYSSNLDRVKERHSTLGYFRPWEKQKFPFREINWRTDGDYELPHCKSSHFDTNQYPDEEFWHDDYAFNCKERQLSKGNVGIGNFAQDIDRKNLNGCENEGDRKEVNSKNSKLYNRDLYYTETKKNTLQTIQGSMLEAVQEIQKKHESDKGCDSSVKEKEFSTEIASQNENDRTEAVSKPQTEMGNVISYEDSNDRFAKKRQDRYNHGHSYSEIVAVKSKNNTNKKVRESSVNNKSLVNECVKSERNIQSNNGCPKLKILKTIKNLVSLKDLNRSKLLKNTSGKTDVSTLSSTQKLNDTSKKISEMSFSKVAKPDISLENTLLKSMTNGRETITAGLDTYKIPLLQRYKKKSEKTIDKGKIKVKNSSKSNAKEKDVTTEQYRKKSNKKHVMSVKIEAKRSIKKTHDKKMHRIVPEKAEKKNKLGVKTANEKQNVAELKCLHPKLRHKFAPSRVDVKKRKLKVALEKCDFEISNDECIRKSYDKMKTYSLKRKCTRHGDTYKNIGNDLEPSKPKSSLLTRGKFVLSTPNTLEIKESNITKVKETTEKRDSGGNSLEEKGNLDKAMLSAKKYLLYRALAVNALKRDKTKPFVEKKRGARKSYITTDMAKKELNVLKETLITEVEKLPDEKDENNNSNSNEKVEDVVKAFAVNLDIPTTMYQPQKTAIGNYATQCLFGPIVSSTFYKAPGKSRVIRNSKESFTGYTKCPEDFGMNDEMFSQASIDSDVKKAINTETLKVDGTIYNVNDVSVSCCVPSCDTSNSGDRSSSLKESNKGIHTSDRENQMYLETEDLSCKKESFQVCPLQSEIHGRWTSLNESTMNFHDFKTTGKLHTIPSVCDDQKKLLETTGNEIKQSMSMEEPLCDNLFLHPKKDVFSVSDQFEMHKRYLLCKQELAESYCSPELKTDLAPVLPPIMPMFPLNTHAVSGTVKNQELPVYSGSQVHERIDMAVNLVNAPADENASDCATNRFDAGSNSDQNLPGSFSGDMSYEPSNEEFEMYRNYQIQRTMTYVDEEGEEPKRGTINDLPLCPEWKGVTEKHRGVGSPFDTTEPEKGSYESEYVYITEDTLPESEVSASVDTTTSPSFSSDMYINVPFAESSPSNKEPLHYGEESLKQKSSCDIVNFDQDLQDTSKDMFEDIVTDILKDEALISSIPINPPDITKVETYSFTNKVNEKLNDNQLIDNIKVEHVSSQIPDLSPKFPLKKVPEKGNSEQTRDEKEQRNVFKSARTPIHFGICRKPRFEKRFPQPFPRAKPQKLTAERDLYEAAERFLGDFDHSHKRSCCKGKLEMLINPVTGKMESVKIDSNRKEPAVNVEKSETVESFGNHTAEFKDNKNHAEKQSDAQNAKVNKIPVDSNVVTRQQDAMKTIILKQKDPKLRTRSKVDDINSQSTTVKRNTQFIGGYNLNNSVKTKNRIPSIRLKSVRQPGAKDKNTPEKWQKVKSKSNGKKDEMKTSGEDAKRLSLKSCKEAENIFNKNVVCKQNRPTKTKKKTNVNQKARVWMSVHSCKLCRYSCDSRTILMLHYNENHPLWCQRCEEEFKDKYACLHHMKQTHNVGAKCELCGTTFKYKSNYERHLKSLYHKENKERADLMKSGLDPKQNTEVTDAVVISDEEESCVEIVDLSHDCYKTTETKDHDSKAGRHKKHKTKTLKSPKLKACAQNKHKRKQKDVEIAETSEDEVEVKKANCLRYCNVCRQYYKKILVHFKTGKHRDMLKQGQKEGKTTAGSQEVIHTLTIDDTDHDTAFYTDDDIVNEDDLETVESLSPSSGRSVVIVSDHDSHCSFEDDSNTLEDRKSGIYEEESAACNKNSVQVERTDLTQSEVECSNQSLLKEPDQEMKSVADDYRSQSSVTMKTDVDTRIMPVVVSACQEGMCSPTLLVKNIAADLMCTNGVKDSRQNIFASLSSEQNCLKASIPSHDKFENDQKKDKHFEVEEDEDMDVRSSLKKENINTLETEQKMEYSSMCSLDRATESFKKINEKVPIVDLGPEEDRNMSIYTEQEDFEMSASVGESADMTDYQVTENPLPADEADPGRKVEPACGNEESSL